MTTTAFPAFDADVFSERSRARHRPLRQRVSRVLIARSLTGTLAAVAVVTAVGIGIVAPTVSPVDPAILAQAPTGTAGTGGAETDAGVNPTGAGAPQVDAGTEVGPAAGSRGDGRRGDGGRRGNRR